MSEGPNPKSPQAPSNRRFEQFVARAGQFLWWERAWPRIWVPLSVVFLFLTVSWLGLWLDLPPFWRVSGLALFVAAAFLSLWPLLRLRWPSRSNALDRLDRDSGLNDAPARALDDTLASGHDDPGTRVLWALHRKRAEEAVARMRIAPPRPDMPGRDLYALRAMGVLALVASAFVAGPEMGSRIGAAFDWRPAKAAPPAFRIDGWIDPPRYTRTPPIMLDLAKDQHLRAPVRSTVVIRIAGDGGAEIAPTAGLTPLPPQGTRRAGLREERFTLEKDAEVIVRTGPRSVRLMVDSVPDKPPEIAFTAPPEVNARGTFTLLYKGKDDYGIVSVEGLVERPEGSRGRSLVPPPHLDLAIPGHEENAPETRSPVDLTNHPWAGAKVTIRLKAKDEAGQEGTSEPITFTLPQRPFTNPLAKALVEQRRHLVMVPDDRKSVQTALDALLIAPETFTPQWGVYMGLRVGASRLRRARTGQDLLDVADWLWTVAVQLEDGGLSDAERELRAAQDRLREAMERGASSEEIKRLTDELRQAMEKFLREFAQRMQQNPQTGDPNQRGPERVISQNDLNRMLQQMEEAMRRGDMAEAQRLLEQLRNILENLQTAQPNSRMTDPLSREMNQAMRDLENMAREQQNLRDDTFRQGQSKRMQQGDRNRMRQRQRGPNGEEQGEAENGQDGQPNQDGQGLSQRQQALREALQELQRRMQGLGMQNEQGLSDADQAMREAENALGQGQDGPAVDAQGRALDALRRGMEGMAQQMQQMQQGEGNDQPGGGAGGEQTTQRDADPLGRPLRDRGMSDGSVVVPGPDAAARARQILDELRRKMGDPSRPQEELDYFDRLLRRN